MQGEDDVLECTAAASMYSFAVCHFYTVAHNVEECVRFYRPFCVVYINVHLPA